jgi:hypothetical protein
VLATLFLPKGLIGLIKARRSAPAAAPPPPSPVAVEEGAQ